MLRRHFLAMGVAGLGALAGGPTLGAPTRQVPLQVSASRSTTLFTWVPERVRGVVLFSTGHGSWPERYEAMFSRWSSAGFAVAAPLHVDSLRYPERDKFTREASFGERIADMRAASALAAGAWPGKPLAAAGHSFGSLTALCLGGALPALGAFRDDRTKAVMCFSSPGLIPGLVGPGAYAEVSLPVMLITGEQDTVPGLVTDWRDHLEPVRTARAGDKYGLVYRTAAHEMIGDPASGAFNSAADHSVEFLRAYLLGDAAAAKAIRTAASTPQLNWTRR